MTIEERLDAMLLSQAHYTTDCIQQSYTDANARMDERDDAKRGIVEDWNAAVSLLSACLNTLVIAKDNHFVCTVCKEWSETADGIEHALYCFADMLRVAIHTMEGAGDE